MRDMDYLIYGLDEIIADESELTKDNMHIWYNLVKKGIKGIEDELHLYDFPSQVRITSALAQVLSKTRFTSMLVYSHFGAFPGLGDLLVVQSGKMRLMASKRDLNTFLQQFYQENIDNNVLTGIMRIFRYTKFLVEEKSDDIVCDQNLEVPRERLRRLATMTYNIWDTAVADCMDVLEFDMMEYVNNDMVIRQLDEIADCKYEEVMMATNGILEKVNSLSIDWISELSKGNPSANIFSGQIYSKTMSYLNKVHQITGKLDPSELDTMASTYSENCKEVVTRSMLNRLYEHYINKITKTLENNATNQSIVLECMCKMIDLLICLL